MVEKQRSGGGAKEVFRAVPSFGKIVRDARKNRNLRPDNWISTKIEDETKCGGEPLPEINLDELINKITPETIDLLIKNEIAKRVFIQRNGEHQAAYLIRTSGNESILAFEENGMNLKIFDNEDFILPKGTASVTPTGTHKV